MFPALEFALFRVMRPEDLLPAITIANGNRRSVRGMALFQRIFRRFSDLTIRIVVKSGRVVLQASDLMPKSLTLAIS